MVEPQIVILVVAGSSPVDHPTLTVHVDSHSKTGVLTESSLFMETLDSIFGYTFRDRSLLTMALTHGSVGYEAQRSQPDNQRLEFLGDAVLQLMLSEFLYGRLPTANEGELTKLRAQIVSTKALAALGRQIGLGRFLIMGRGEAANGGRDRESCLADALEAIVGAVYLDGGLIGAQTVTQKLFLPEVERLLSNPGNQNPKGQLQEIIQAVGSAPPQYEIVSQSGPDHAKSFLAQVKWMGSVLGQGSGSSKKEAEAQAAISALGAQNLGERLNTLVEQNIKITEISKANCEQLGDKSEQVCEQTS